MQADPAVHESGQPAIGRAQLGPFVLERPIGAGGMGEVWRAVHSEEQTPVAIKVIGPHWARQPSYRQAFAREVRAIAGLVHPGIVTVHDQGVVGAAAARASGDRIAADSPYLVMEYMPRGSLEGLLGALDWPLVRVLLREILEALAHAHARGVVHCDLKPGNVLLSGTVDVAIKLTDFGVAHVLAPGDSLLGDDTPRSAGTPAYMAPEQLLGLWRDFGPWTDLYALGCMLWEMCCGAPPFMAGSLVRLAGMHLHETPGRFIPCFAVPAAFEGWLRRLLAKQTRDRFACAADAAWALARLPGPEAPGRLTWATVAARSAEVDRAAPTQPLPAPIDPPTTDRAASWSADSTLVGPIAGAAIDVGAATRAGGASRTAGEAGAIDVGGATQWTGEVPAVDVRGATRMAETGAIDGGAATRLVGEGAEVDVAGATRIADAVDVAGETRMADAGVDPQEPAAARRDRSSDPAGQRVRDTIGQVPEDMSDRTGDAPPLPGSWRRPGDTEVLRPLRGAGLALYRFREVPLVGRVAERDALWEALAQVYAQGQPRALLVRGPSGVGKSRLIEWLATRSHEAGAATVLRASHGPFGGPGDGLPRMLASHLQCVGLAGDEIHARVLATLGADVPSDRSEQLRYEAAALTEFMAPGGDGERPRVRLAEQRERHAVLAGYLRRCTARRPAILWLDDAMWGPEALDFTRHLLSDTNGPRVLLVLTVRDDVVAERPAEARLLSELAALPGVTTLDVAPLAEAEHRALIHERLGLDAGLVEAVLERAGGNPLFSVQLVGDWIARGLLTQGPGGFALPPDASLDLPDDMHALWQERLARLLAGHYTGAQAQEARQALELAAAFGLEVDPQAWARGCALEGLRPPAGIVELLVAQRLAVTTRGGWAFVHGMLRESLEDLAAEAGRRALHHRSCVEVLRALHGGHAQGHAEEVARHLIAAGALQEALDPLLDATYQMQLSGQYERAERVLAEHATLADRVGLASADVRRLRGRMQGVWLTWMRGGEGSLALARARCRAVEVVARQAGHDDVLGEALRWHGLVGRFERRFDESLAALEQAMAAFRRAGDLGGQARTALACAVTLRATGRLDAAEDELAEAERLAIASDLQVLMPRITGNLAEIALQRADWPAAQARFGRALAAAEALGDRKAMALTLGGAGDLALAQDRLDEADGHYARAEALFASLGSRYVHGVRLHRATVGLLRGDPAVRPYRPYMASFVGETHRDPLALAQAQLGLAVCAGREGAWQEFDRAIAAAVTHVAQARETRPVLVQLLRVAGETARVAGEVARADSVAAIAGAQAQRLRPVAGA